MRFLMQGHEYTYNSESGKIRNNYGREVATIFPDSVNPITHENGDTDFRYTMQQEYCGFAGPRYVMRFCDEYLGQGKTGIESALIGFQHAIQRVGYSVREGAI